MDETELLRTIRPIWIDRVTLSLAAGAGLREDSRAQFERFFATLEQVIETGDLTLMEPVLLDWANSLTQSDLESSQSSMAQIIREMLVQTHAVCRETLSADQALNLASALTPCFGHAFEKISQYETQMRVSYISNQLKQAQDTLERLDRSKSDFIAVAAHELKTPLTLIEGYTAMLREARDKNFQPQELELMNGINSGTRRLKDIIDDMIDVSMIDNDLLQLNFQPVWINRILKILKSELESATKERDLKVMITDFPGASEMTYGDPE